MVALVLVFCLIASAYGNAIESRIVGGIDTVIQNVPYIVQIEKSGVYACAGTIVNEHWVVTSADCVVRTSAAQISVLAGSNRLGQGTQYSATRYVIHDDWIQMTAANDIALIRVAPTIQFNDYVQPAALYPIDPPAGEDAFIAGWGYTQEVNGTLQDILKLSLVPIVDRAVCNDIFGFIDNSQVCAGYVNGGADPCTGDNGGPLTIRQQLAGIIVGSIGCARPEVPAVFTNVYTFIDWITDITTA